MCELCLPWTRPADRSFCVVHPHPLAPDSPAFQPTKQKLGKDLASLEASQSKLNDKLMKLSSSGAADMSQIEAVSLQLADLQAQYEAKEERWLELAEIAGDL